MQHRLEIEESGRIRVRPLMLVELRERKKNTSCFTGEEVTTGSETRREKTNLQSLLEGKK